MIWTKPNKTLRCIGHKQYSIHLWYGLLFLLCFYGFFLPTNLVSLFLEGSWAALQGVDVSAAQAVKQRHGRGSSREPSSDSKPPHKQTVCNTLCRHSWSVTHIPSVEPKPSLCWAPTRVNTSWKPLASSLGFTSSSSSWIQLDLRKVLWSSQKAHSLYSYVCCYKQLLIALSDPLVSSNFFKSKTLVTFYKEYRSILTLPCEQWAGIASYT